MWNFCDGLSRMRYAWMDWVFMGLIVLAVVSFFSFTQQRNAIGQVAGGTLSLPAQDCISYPSSQPIVVTSSLLLCPDAIHYVDYFELVESDIVINCQGSTVQGSGGALLVARGDSPTITLRNCSTQGYDGLYSTQNPVVVRVE